MSLVDIIIPTYINPQYVISCVDSIMREYDPQLFHVYVVNNGNEDHCRGLGEREGVTILNQPFNRGWEGGLKAGLIESKSPYVMFMNDDTFVPVCSKGWIKDLLRHFIDPRCGAVGPSSNFVMGSQQLTGVGDDVIKTRFLIGLCLLMRRKDLDDTGGVDDTLTGGDDLDLSMRLKDMGKYLIADKSVFIYHHGARTGSQVHSDWNSIEMTERTNFCLVRKHGLRKWMNLWDGPVELQKA